MIEANSIYNDDIFCRLYNQQLIIFLLFICTNLLQRQNDLRLNTYLLRFKDESNLVRIPQKPAKHTAPVHQALIIEK